MDLPAQIQNQLQAASANNNQQSAASAGPQIRARITVVCAECKRLKLKCDRRTPCGSCTKRDTVVRCVYSPAAAEKVDLHSLNNRLIQVEAILAMITNGQNPPAFQSSYPLTYSTSSNTAQQAVGTASLVPHSSGAHPHQHHHHYAAPSHISPHDSLSLSFNEMSSMWLEDLDLGLSCLPSTSHSASPTAQRQRSYSNPDNVGLIKLEPSPIDIELTQPQITPHSNNSGRPTSFPSRAPSPVKRNSFTRSEHYHQQQQKRSSAQQLLPALSIYYPIPSIPPPGTSVSSSAPFSHHPSNASPSSTSPSTSPTSISANNGNDPSSNLQTQYTKPQVTQALIALLPSLLTCNVFLRNARDIFRLRPIPFECGPEQGWKHFENRCLTLLGGGTNKEKAKEREKKEREREKAREARRARQIYFGGIPGLQPHVVQDTDMDDAGGGSSKNATKANADPADENEDISLTFFAIMCAVLAIGASIPPAAGSPISSSTADAIKSSPAFLFALSQQALGVWDTHASSVTFSNPSAAAEESEKLDYLLACIAGLCYLLFTSSPMRVSDTEGEGSGVTGLVYPLVGKLVNAARGMGLAKDTAVLSSALASRKSKSGGDGPGERPGAPNGQGHSVGGTGVSKGASKREREAERERIREEWKKMIWWEVLFYDLFTSDAQGHQPHIPAHLFGLTLPECSTSSVPLHGDEHSSDEDSEHRHGLQHDELHLNGNTSPSENVMAPVEGDTYEHERDYLGARYRLTRLAHTVRTRPAHPDCCCGYTLDQASQLEAEVRRWQATLPVSLRWAEHIAVGPDPAPSPFHRPHGSNTDKVVHLQSCELAVMGNLLLMKIYTPFLRHIADTGTANSTPALEAPAVNASAAQTTLHAAQMIIRAVKDAYATQAVITIFPTSPSSVSSPLASPGKTPAWPAAVSPAMFDLYPLDRVVFHAAVVCSYAGLGGKPPSGVAMSVDIDGALHDATVALSALLIEQGAPSVGPLGDAQHKVAEVLYKRVLSRANTPSHGMKRKHSQINLNNPFGAVLQSNWHLGNAIGISSPEHGWAVGASNGSNTGRYQQNGTTMETSPPVSAVLPANFPHDRLARTQQQKDELASSVRLALAERAAQREEDEKEKKYAKKASYPSVGFRVRPNKDALTRPRQHSHSNGSQPAPPMASPSRPLPAAEAVMAYQQQQKQKMQVIPESAASSSTSGQHPPSTDYDQDLNRSRSSSFGHMQALQQQQQQQQMPQRADGSPEDIHYPYFGASAPSDMINPQMAPRKRFSIHEQVQAQQQSAAPEHSPFTTHLFEHTAQAMYEQPFDRPSGGAVEGMGYSTVSSPFSNGGPASSSGSPFTTTSVVSSGHPSTPTFAPHHPVAPVFGPQPLDTLSTSSPTSYFHTPAMFNDPYPGPPSSAHHSHQPHGPHSVPLGMNMDQSDMDVPPAQSYVKAAQHQATVYDMKPEMEHHQIVHHQRQMQQQPMERPYDDQTMDGQSHQLEMGMSQSQSSWAVTEQHPPHPSSQNQPFWNNGNEYRFYP